MTNTTTLLHSMKAVIAARTAAFTEMTIEKTGKTPTAFDVEMFQLGLQIDALKAFGRYIKATDAVSVFSVKEERGVIVFFICVEREGKTFPMSTDMIYAGGHNIQALHTRYIVKTDLPSMEAKQNTLAASLIAKQAKLTKTQKLQAEVAYLTQCMNRDLAKVETMMQMTETEILEKGYLTDCSWNKLNDWAKAHYESPAKYAAWVKAEIEKELANHAAVWNLKKVAAISKDFSKRIGKLEAKIAAL